MTAVTAVISLFRLALRHSAPADRGRIAATARRCAGYAPWIAAIRRQPPDPSVLALYAKANPKHYHRRSEIRFLVGHVSNVPWFGKTCPPECPGIGAGRNVRADGAVLGNSRHSPPPGREGARHRGEGNPMTVAGLVNG